MTDIKVVYKQFNIEGAEEKLGVAHTLEDVFSPPHHGPRNVPIEITLPPIGTPIGDGKTVGEYSYMHFPIVETGEYAIYLDREDVFEPDTDIHNIMIYAGTNQTTGTGTEIKTIPAPTLAESSSSIKLGFVSAEKIIFSSDDPQPIAIRFPNQDKEVTVKYIVSRINILCES